MSYYFVNAEDKKIIKAAQNGNLELLRQIRDETGGNEAFRKKCERIAGFAPLTCLHMAAMKGYVEICRFLIEEVKVNIEIITDTGETPLVIAALNEKFEAVEYFINQGADVKKSSHRGITCLYMAARCGKKELMQLLLLKGADIEAQSLNGTPLQCVAALGEIESVRFLISHGADPNAVSPISLSPLMGAICCHSHELVELFLKAGADPNKESFGASPLALAAKDNGTRSIKLLLRAGANPSSTTTDNDSFRSLDEQGKDAAKGKNYELAVKIYTKAIYLQPKNARLLSNRSLCWAKLNEPIFAIHDAEESLKRDPKNPKAYYRAGAAWMLLKCYHKACQEFKRASTLEPQNMEIKTALSLAQKPLMLILAERDLLNLAPFLALQFHIDPSFYIKLNFLAMTDPTEAMKILHEFLDRPDLPQCVHCDFI